MLQNTKKRITNVSCTNNINIITVIIIIIIIIIIIVVFVFVVVVIITVALIFTTIVAKNIACCIHRLAFFFSFIYLIYLTLSRYFCHDGPVAIRYDQWMYVKIDDLA